MSVEPTVKDIAGRAHVTPLAIGDVEFRRLRDLIYAHTGITLSEHKRALVCARLGRRLRHLNLPGYAEYYSLLAERDPEGHELMEMINAITTNKTGFFREPHHFQFLSEQVFPALRASHSKRVRIWSAASSTGEEAYSIAITARESLPLAEYDVKILASDIDTNVLQRAAQGQYTLESIEHVPEKICARYFLKGRGDNEGKVSIKQLLKSIVRFRHLNLNQPTWPMQGPFDVIFCRNVLIYFDKETQRRLILRFADMIRPGGYLMLGHAEAVHGFDNILRTVGHSIYQRRAEGT